MPVDNTPTPHVDVGDVHRWCRSPPRPGEAALPPRAAPRARRRRRPPPPRRRAADPTTVSRPATSWDGEPWIRPPLAVRPPPETLRCGSGLASHTPSCAWRWRWRRRRRDGEPGGRKEEEPASGGGEVHEAAGAVPAPGHRPEEAAPPHRRGQARALLPRLRRPPPRPRRVPHLLPVLSQSQPVQVLRQGNLHGGGLRCPRRLRPTARAGRELAEPLRAPPPPSWRAARLCRQPAPAAARLKVGREGADRRRRKK